MELWRQDELAMSTVMMIENAGSVQAYFIESMGAGGSGGGVEFSANPRKKNYGKNYCKIKYTHKGNTIKKISPLG